MAEEGFKRKLTAILSADVIGYSRLMRDDEEATVRDIAVLRVLIFDIVQKHHGRVVDSPGDNILAEFASVVDAVNGAINIQEEISKSNADTPEDRRMEFRIGINLGDVIEEEERIYGDGVNIAARVEGLASAGGIAISGTVYEHIKDKLSLGYHFLGEKDVKNIPEPVRVYRLLTEPDDAGKMTGVEIKTPKKGKIWIAVAAVFVAVIGIGIWQFYMRRPAVEPASEEKMAYPLPDKPSIAVLAFDNLSGEPSQEYFSDGLTEQIISALSKIPNLFVIARNSSFTYKGKPVKVQQVSEELGVRYVLEGSVRKANDRLRITAQLIDAITGHHLWSESYDRELKDIFAIQDEITIEILSAMQVQLTEGERVRVRDKYINNLKAYLKILEGLQYSNKYKFAEAIKRFEDARTLDPQSPVPYGYLSFANLMKVWLGATANRSESIEKAAEYAEKCKDLNNKLSACRQMLSNVHLIRRQYDKAISEGRIAVEFEPNSALAALWYGWTLRSVGRYEDALREYEIAIRLDPLNIATPMYHKCATLNVMRQHEDAAETCKRVLEVNPKYLPVYYQLAVAYSSLNRMEEARDAASKILNYNPNFTVENFAKGLPYKKQADIDLLLNGLRKAGLPDKPPLPLPDKPSIAVLAFDNLSGDPEQEYFSDGLSEEIINALSKIDRLFVIARNSSFTYKGKPANVKKISRELGVRYVLEGSVRKSEDRVRITAQLIDATTGHHLWSERYDRDLKDIFAVQDEITMKIITALQVELTDGEQMRIWAKRVKRLDVLLKGMEMISLSRKGTQESVIRWGQVAQEVVDMAPDLAVGYRHLGWYHYFLAAWGKSPRENLKKAYGFALKAISLDEYDGMSHGLLGNVYLTMRQHEKAIAAGKRAIELDPNVADVHMYLGYTLNFAGRPDEALGYLNKAIRLNPFPPYYVHRNMGQSYLLKGQYEKALPEFKKALQLAPKSSQIHINLAVIYILLGREKEARASADKALELFPNLSVSWVAKTAPYKNQADLELILDAMRKAGFPEGA
ncbi:MAG: tetratricopeptide repeat protein [Desulfobacterales bacterium]|jgi:adenylate cyclase